MTDELDVLLSLTELGIPPMRAADLVNEVPAAEITRVVLEGFYWNIPLGQLIDNLAYRQDRIRDRWDSALVNVWRDAPPPRRAPSLAEQFFTVSLSQRIAA